MYKGSKNKMLKLINVVFVLLILFFTNQSNAGIIEYEFNQKGWFEYHAPIDDRRSFGEVNGYFAGEDLNNNGELEFFELTSYGVSFSGNAEVEAFTHNFSDLQFFNYTIGSIGFSQFGAGSWPLYSDNGMYGYDGDDGYIGNAASSKVTGTSLTAFVTRAKYYSVVWNFSVSYF
jgi:hypothetical protein